MAKSLKERYGNWALIAGGAQGIGRAFAEQVAAAGMNVVVIDRDRELLADCCRAIESSYGVEAEGLAIDLASQNMLQSVIDAVGEREIGLLIYNAALADVGPFFKDGGGVEQELVKAQVNMLSPLALIYHFAQPMLMREQGGIILMSSGSGLQGSPYYSHYAATKAYSIVLAESLWFEFKPYNVDVLACIAGMTLSPAVAAAVERGEGQHSTYQFPEEVAAEGLEALGRSPSHICGVHNRDNQALLNSLPREKSVAAIAQHAIENFLGGGAPRQFLNTVAERE